jgi:predicted dehydrogenase
MPDVRLKVYHPNEAVAASLRARLRGAIVETCDQFPTSRTADCDALLVAGPYDIDGVAQFLKLKVPVALVARAGEGGIEQLYAAARASEVPIAIVNPDRFLPSRQLIRQQIGNTLGEVGLLRLHRWESSHENSLLLDLDTATWLMGREPNRVYAIAGGDRYVQVHLGFPPHGMALIDCCCRLLAGDGYQSLHVIAASGAAYADDHQNMQLLYRGGQPRAVRTEERARQLAAIAQDFMDGLRSGRDWSAGEAEWRRVFATAAAVRQSLAARRAVALENH